MPTINEVLEQAGRIRPDAIDDATKASWLLELDGQLRNERRERYEEDLGEGPAVYPEDGDMPLLVAGEHERVYLLYLFAQADAVDREADNYNNSAALFNEALDSCRKAWHRSHMPRDKGNYKNHL